MTYIEGFLTPVPAASRDAYLAHAERALRLAPRLAPERLVVQLDIAPHRLARDVALATPLRARNGGQPLFQFGVETDAEHRHSFV